NNKAADVVITAINNPDPTNAETHSSGLYTRVIFICRVVNAKSSPTEQLPNVAHIAPGTSFTPSPASCTARAITKSSERVPAHFSRISSCSNVSRRIAVDPPQAKFDVRFDPSDEATDAFQTLLSSPASDHGRLTNHRYPVAAPTPSSIASSTSDRSHPAPGLASESTNTNISARGPACGTPSRKFATFWLESAARSATTSFTCRPSASCHAASIISAAGSPGSSMTKITSSSG